ncbi:hypothetical protein Tco_1386626 [Tanacetum coccineum]
MPPNSNDTDDDYMDFDNNPSQYCLDNMSIGIEEDTQNGELTHTEKIGLRGEDKQIANENSDFDTLLKDPLDKLNDLANKRRKHADDIHDYFKAYKRLKSSVQYKDHLPRIVLNEPVLEIFFILHQGPGLDDHVLLAEIDKRNLNPLKQMRVIEQLRQYNVIFRPEKIGKYLHISKLKLVVSLLEGLQGGKMIALCQKE